MQTRFKGHRVRRRTRPERHRPAQTNRPPADPLLQATEAALANYEQAFRNGLKLQEQAAHWWGRVLSQTWFSHHS